jgi:hypothetical protein
MANGFVDLTQIGQEVENLCLPETDLAPGVTPLPEPDLAFDDQAPLPLPAREGV